MKKIFICSIAAMLTAILITFIIGAFIHWDIWFIPTIQEKVLVSFPIIILYIFFSIVYFACEGVDNL